jgi:hypothetical protein
MSHVLAARSASPGLWHPEAAESPAKVSDSQRRIPVLLAGVRYEVLAQTLVGGQSGEWNRGVRRAQ